MLSKKIVVVDVDDVLYGLNEALESVLKDKYPSYSRENVKTWKFNSDLSDECKLDLGIDLKDPTNGLGVPLEDIYFRLHTTSLFRHESDFRYAIPRFKELCDKCEVVISTSGTTVDICKFKVAMLNSLLNELGVTACISVHMCAEYVSEYVSDGKSVYKQARGSVPKPAITCDYVIEDSVDNLKRYDTTVSKFLVDKPYNQLSYCNEENVSFLIEPRNQVLRVSDINEAIDKILSED